VEQFLKQAFEEGKRQAAEELAQKLKAAVKQRESLVGWKENSVAPNRLSSSNK
jgi:hypothetical protein